jgi:DNA repair photolyase
MRTAIYEPKGRAREFAELACNIFTGCEHGCVYCYSPQVLHKTKEEFAKPRIRIGAWDVLKSAKQLVEKGETRRVLFNFVHDPYTPIEQETMLTRKCIMALHEAGLNVIILTKGGLKSMRDFDLLTSKDAYAVTLTCMTMADSLKWEPYAAHPVDRIRALSEAHDRGIETWVSFEPVLYPEQVRQMMLITQEFTGHYKLGKLNYISQLPPRFQDIVKGINWHDFGWEMKELMDKLGIKYYFKKDLLKQMGVIPENFVQTWKCG